MECLANVQAKTQAKLIYLIWPQNLDLINEEDCPELEDVEVPKVLGDTVEAAMGAVFVDSGFDLGVVWACFRRLFPNMEEVIKRNPRNVVAREAIQ